MGSVSVLDRGVYYISEAARLLGITPSTLTNWLDGYTRGGIFHPPILRAPPSRPAHGQRVVTWGEFIEAGHLAAYRRQARIPLQRLRAYVDDWRGEQGIPYPLAHCKPHIGPGRQLLDHDGRRAWRHEDGQRQMPASNASVDAFFDRIDFDDKVAARYWPAGKAEDIVVDPVRQFGSPTIPGTCIRTATLNEMHTGATLSAGWPAPMAFLSTKLKQRSDLSGTSPSDPSPHTQQPDSDDQHLALCKIFDGSWMKTCSASPLLLRRLASRSCIQGMAHAPTSLAALPMRTGSPLSLVSSGPC